MGNSQGFQCFTFRDEYFDMLRILWLSFSNIKFSSPTFLTIYLNL